MKIGLVVNRGKPEAGGFVAGLVAWLKSRSHEPILATSTARAYGLEVTCCPSSSVVRRAELVVALGGDGTLLRAARLVGRRDVAIMGVNLGGLGFLTAFSTREARRGIEAFVRGRHNEERRMLLSCECGSKRGFALNDCAVNMGAAGRVIRIIARSADVFINRFVGDGVVVATPTGSTAYSLAAAGPVVVPTMEAILLTPVAPHALAARPLILPADTHLELELAKDSDPAIINLDGQRTWNLKPGIPVVVTRADFSIRLVTPKDKTYYSILRDKMKWSGSQV